MMMVIIIAFLARSSGATCYNDCERRGSLLFIFLLLIVAKDIRAELKEDKACLPSIRTLKASADPTIAKHASIALEAVLWDP